MLTKPSHSDIKIQTAKIQTKCKLFKEMYYLKLRHYIIKVLFKNNNKLIYSLTTEANK